MTAAADTPQPARRIDFQRWRRRSRLVRALRLLLPAMIVLIFAGLAGSVVYSTFSAQPQEVASRDEPIRLVNPRYSGRDDKGRSFVLTAISATRDPADYERVILEKPALVVDEGGADEMRIRGELGVYRESDGKLQLTNGVRLADTENAFATAASMFDTKTGELVGSGPIQGSGGLGEVRAEFYAVYGKGERLVFKGDVQTRLETKK